MNAALDGWAVMERALELSRKGEAFALATVVWRTAPSSGQDGARAIVTADGEVYGWVGGACAEPVLIREARDVITSGTARLLWLGQPDELADLHVPQGVTAVPMACQSEGALQIFIEPAHAAPRLVVVGRSPMAVTLVRLAEALDWSVHPVEGDELTVDLLTPTSVVVVATQGHGDEEVLEQALAADPQYVGLVASHRRGAAVLGYLAERGIDQDRLDRVRFPVGLDLGSTSHREIAVAVLAELVQLRAAGEISSRPAGVTLPRVDTTVDPVCGMTVDVDPSNHPFEHEGRTYHFCCPGCRYAFAKDPAAFLTQELT
jgi:xanthine dehydrogenase accessory factor